MVKTDVGMSKQKGKASKKLEDKIKKYFAKEVKDDAKPNDKKAK